MNATREIPADHSIAICNKLLRGELAAVETYGQAIMKYDTLPESDELRRIRMEHSNSAKLLAANVRALGGYPTPDSGAWGLFVSAVQGAANLLGEESALESLKQGEEIGRKDYEEALQDERVVEDFRVLIRTELLPPVMNHIAVLQSREQAA
ncbi:MAG: DUF2383 domain-containing protein [Verrucomicrobiaceae bacterium]|nr:MAG: DUF2383 domain-containing protein [Verrucomicrobiaceae bacterium]